MANNFISIPPILLFTHVMLPDKIYNIANFFVQYTLIIRADKVRYKMNNSIQLISAVKNCTPGLVRTLKNMQKIEQSVSAMSKVGNNLRDLEIGALFRAFSNAGQEISGQDGIITICARQAKNTQNATIISATIKKGKEVVAKISGFISQKGKKIGGSIKGTGFYYADKVASNAQSFKELAQKLGVDINTAMSRLRTANGAGIIIKDEKTMADVILGKYKTTISPKSISNFAEKVSTESDPMSMDQYFRLGYKRLVNSNTDPNTSKSDWLHDIISDARDINGTYPKWKEYPEYIKAFFGE